jgi:DNA/RNA endonuclease G (NUC1)
MEMARITYKKINYLLLCGLLGVSTSSYAVDPKTIIVDIFGTKAGAKAVDNSEGKNLDKFMAPNKCRKHYTWGEPRVKDELTLTRSLFICRVNFANQYDTKLKVPIWTSEHLNSNDKKFLSKTYDLDTKFKPDDDLPSSMMAYPEDYLNSIYTPVQMASVYNTKASDIKLRPLQVFQQHFNFSNTIPMVRDNLANTIWSDLEDEVRGYLKNADALYVTTGPIYLNGKPKGSLGKSGVAIPTHFYKVITQPNVHGTVAYIIPNQEIYTSKTKKLNDPQNAYRCNGGPCTLSNFIVQIKEVERLINMEFYPTLAPQYAVKVKLDPNEIHKLERREEEMNLSK